MVVLSDSEYEIAFDQAQILTLSDIVYAMDVLGRAFERMGKGNDNRTELEIALVKLSSPELDASNEALLSRIAALEKTVKLLSANPQPQHFETKAENNKPVVTSPAKTEEVKAKEEPKAETQVAPAPKREEKPAEVIRPQQVREATEKKVLRREPVDMEAIMNDAKPLRSWPEVVANLKQYSRVIASSFEGTTAYESGDYLLIDARSDIPFKLLQKSDQRENLRNAVQEITGKRYILGPYKKAEKKEKEDDPLEELISDLKDSNVEIIET